MLYLVSGNNSPFLCIAYALQNDIAQLAVILLRSSSRACVGVATWAAQGFPEENPSSQSVKTPRSWCVSCRRLPESITRERTRCRTGSMICLSRRCRLSSGSVTPIVHTRTALGRAAGESPLFCAFPPDYIIKHGCHCHMSLHDTYSHSSQMQ